MVCEIVQVIGYLDSIATPDIYNVWFVKLYKSLATLIALLHLIFTMYGLWNCTCHLQHW